MRIEKIKEIRLKIQVKGLNKEVYALNEKITKLRAERIETIETIQKMINELINLVKILKEE